jgi:hypothetical protein
MTALARSSGNYNDSAVLSLERVLISTYLQLSDSDKNLVLGPRRTLEIKDRLAD